MTNQKKKLKIKCSEHIHKICSNKPNKLNKIRHETPVLDHPIKIIHIDNDLIVLDKPSSVPVSN